MSRFLLSPKWLRRSPVLLLPMLAAAMIMSSCLTPEFTFGDDPSDRSPNGTGGPGVGGAGAIPEHCDNRQKDADETDVDCGGLDCDSCALGRFCSSNGDCVNGSCTAGKCQDPSCTDGEKNGAETDVDCGGSACGPCGPELKCERNSDCNSKVCASGTCAPPSCDDRVENGKEVDVDCGGDCELCDVGQGCVVNGDCEQPSSETATAVTVCSNDKVCTLLCDTGTADCNQKAADGCEVDTNLSLSHCGACGASCDLDNAAASKCQGGTCLIDFDSGGCEDGFDDCNGLPEDGCEININTNVDHCGECNDACSSANGTPSCSGGICAIICDEGFGDCDTTARTNGCETNTNSSVDHCNGCGNDCPKGAGSQSANCADGECGLTDCPAGTGDCDGDTTCSDDLTTTTNCGSCGDTCSATNATVTCSGGTTCAISGCLNGMNDCNGQYGDGCESDPQLDVNNCGGCASGAGQSCTALKNTASLNIAAITCSGGGCRITSCKTNYADCDGSAANGCEVNIMTSEARCGGCASTDARADEMGTGENCNTKWANASGICSDGTCGAMSCDSGYGNCINGQADGCETNTTNTDEHCGACDDPCASDDGYTSENTCSSSSCTATCNSDGGQCDGNHRNGCENVESDADNCGACGTTCGGNGTNVDTASCSSKTCSVTCLDDLCPDLSDPERPCTQPLGTTSNCSTCGEACGGSAPFCTASGCKDHLLIQVVNDTTVATGKDGAGDLAFTHALSTSRASNSTRAVVVMLGHDGNDHSNLPPQVSYGGVDMTLAAAMYSGNQSWAGIYYILDASLSSGTGNRTVYVEGDQSNTQMWTAHVVELINVDQSSPLEEAKSQGASGSACNADLTVATSADAWVASVLNTEGDDSFSALTSQTVLEELLDGEANTIAGYLENVAAGTQRVRWSCNDHQWTHVVASFNPEGTD